jgi:hypothetical protein
VSAELTGTSVKPSSWRCRPPFRLVAVVVRAIDAAAAVPPPRKVTAAAANPPPTTPRRPNRSVTMSASAGLSVGFEPVASSAMAAMSSMPSDPKKPVPREDRCPLNAW